MKKIQKLSIGLFLLLSSCVATNNKVYFTEDLRQRAVTQGIDFRQVQFFNDKDIILRRKIVTSESSVKKGGLQMNDATNYEYVTIKKGTPGLCTDIDSLGNASITWEKAERKGLMFKRNKSDVYQIGAAAWVNQMGEVTYKENKFDLLPESRHAMLMVKKDHEQKVKTKKVTAEGIVLK
jgi:hypothetical protein